MHDPRHEGSESDDAQVSARRNKYLRKQGSNTAAERPAMTARKRASAYTGRLHARRVPETRGAWPGKRGRRPAWSDVRLAQIDEATEFSTDRALSDPVQLIEELKRHPQYLAPMRAATRHLYERTPSPANGVAKGRPRRQGDWVLLYLAFVMSGDTSRMSFFNRYASSLIWGVCGFEAPPDYELLRLRFNELERYWEGMREMSQAIVRQAVRHDPDIADFWVIDSTGWQTPSTLEHCCTDKRRCRELLEARGKTKTSKANGLEGALADLEGDEIVKSRRRGAPQRLRRVSADVIERERHREQAAPEPDPTRPAESAIEPLGADEQFQYFLIDGHRYRSRDTTAGMRHYSSGKGKTWFGGYGQPAISPKYGAPIAAETFAADDQEWDHYDDLFKSAVAATGKSPLAVSADRGFSIKSFFEYNTRRGVATVVPHRATPGEPERKHMRTDLVDEHGVPRCQHCGGEGDMDGAGLGWYLDNAGQPRIRFRCKAPLAQVAGCAKQQSIACDEEWRLLQPLNLTQPVYHALREYHFHFERIFSHWRQRYGVYGKNSSSCLRRKGVPAQRLRAQAAVFLDWFRICLRHGFLGSWRTRNHNTAKSLMESGTRRLKSVLTARRKRKLDLPYGKAAERLGLWRRVPPAPPGVPPPEPDPPELTDDIPF